MKQGNNNRRGRGRGPRKPHGMGQHGAAMTKTNQTYDSNGPDIRVRGNAHQVLEKYLQMARDAGSAGDRVAAENYLQHAEHYYRMISAQTEGQRPRVGGRDLSVADVNVQNVSQGLSAALYATAGTSGALPEGDVSDEGDPDQPDSQPLANGNYVPQADGNGRSNGYNAGRNRDNGGRGNGGRDNNNRENSRDNGNRDHSARDNGNRDNGNRDSGNRDNGRENSGRENSARESGNRDNGGREYANRDGVAREANVNANVNGGEVAVPQRRPSRAPAVNIDEQPDYPVELLPVAPVAVVSEEAQPSLALVPADVVPVDGAPAGDSADGAGNAPRRGRGRPRGSTNRRTPRSTAAGGDTNESAPTAVAPTEPGE